MQVRKRASKRSDHEHHLLDVSEEEVMAKNDKFIQNALNPKHKGQLTAKASKAGMSLIEFSRAHIHDGDITGRQARFFLNVLHRVNARGR